MSDQPQGKNSALARGRPIACALAALLLVLPVSGASQAETVRKKDKDAVVKVEADDAATQARGAPPPRTILISLRKQRLRVLDGTREIASSRISSGQPGFDSPTGVFSILEKNVYHESNIYEGAPMPFMQRITWSGIAMHAGVVPGYRASHGCIRLPHSFAKSLFDKTNVGGRVIITNDEVSPVRFEHDLLFKPLPENDPQPAQGASASPRLAANDQGPGGGAALNSLVTPAMADEMAKHAAGQPVEYKGPPRSRAEANRMLEDKLQRLKDELKTAETAKLDASEKAKAALAAANDAETKLKNVRQPFEAVLKAAAAAEARRKSASDDYRKFLSSMSAVADGKTQLAQEDKEFDLENRLLDATIEADTAKAGAAEAELAIADAKSTFAIADAERIKATDLVRNTIIALRTAQTALIDLQKEQQRRSRQLSVFISLKSQKLFVRQGFEPVYESQIDVDDPPGAIGTHVLTAVDYDKTGDGFSWLLVSAQPPRVATGEDDDGEGKRKKKSQAVAVGVGSPMNLEAARVALDAIRVPQEAKDLIAELARPGMSLIISEKELSKETGKGTEFVILTR